MANRLQFTAECVKSQKKHVDSSIDYFGFADLLPRQLNQFRLKVRAALEKEVKDAIIPYVESATFPQPLIEKLKHLEILKHFFQQPYGVGTSCLKQGVLIAELTRIDPGFATVYLVQAGLLGYTIDALGSQEQKAKYLPKIINMDWIGGWALTQDLIGSDASNLNTTSTKTENGYLLNGTKRWMGNANRQLLIVFAKNEKKDVQGWILETHKNPKGWKSDPIKNKQGLRVVQNCHTTFKDVLVQEEHKLPVAKNFQLGANVVLGHSRPIVCWNALGICLGVYDHAIKYVMERKQFGRPVAGFQLVQEKLVRIMGNIQAMLMLCYRLSQLFDSGKAEMGQIAMTKAWVTERGREVARLGRQICGGNGLLHQNYVMRAITDMQAVYTYEGTYQINSLVAGRHLTGLSAFK